MTSDHSAQAPADLTIELYTTPGRTFTSAATPEGPGDLPTWSPSSATLIYGDHDAILVDTLITYDQVDALADWIEAKGRRLSRVYITHGHGDHWLGLARLAQRFPGVKGLATAEALAQATDPAMAGYWDAGSPDAAPLSAQTRRTYASKVRQYLIWLTAADTDGDPLAEAAAGDWAVRDYRTHLTAVLKREPRTGRRGTSGDMPQPQTGKASGSVRLARYGRCPVAWRVSGTLMDLQPSMATVRYRLNVTPG